MIVVVSLVGSVVVWWVLGVDWLVVIVFVMLFDCMALFLRVLETSCGL